MTQRQEKSADARVSYCYDGDTFTLTDGTKVRLACINTPELRSGDNREAGKAARDHLRAMVTDVELGISRYEFDRFGRLVAEFFLPDGRSVSEQMVLDGHAEVFSGYHARHCDWATTATNP